MALKSGKRKQRSQKNHVREAQPVEPVHEWKHSFIAFLQLEAFICSIIFRTEAEKLKNRAAYRKRGALSRTGALQMVSGCGHSFCQQQHAAKHHTWWSHLVKMWAGPLGLPYSSMTHTCSDTQSHTFHCCNLTSLQKRNQIKSFCKNSSIWAKTLKIV